MHNRRTEWSFRLREEMMAARSAAFITLTYSDENLPWGDAPTLCKRDLQLFIKRLRKANSLKWEHQMRYYAVGEYGTDSKRPHYHILLFNCESTLYSQIPEIWGLGHTDIGDVNDASIHYTTKYHVNYDKKVVGKEPEFAVMSRRPGIGENYVKRAGQWNIDNEALFVTNQGFKQKMPRYYKKKIFTETMLERMTEEQTSKAQTDYWKEVDRLQQLGIRNPDLYMENSNYEQSKLIKRKAGKI